MIRFTAILLIFLAAAGLEAKSIEEIQREWRQKFSEIKSKQSAAFWQDEDAKRILPHCQSGDSGACRRLLELEDKHCQEGNAARCSELARLYSLGNEGLEIKPNKGKAKRYADRVCEIDAVSCAAMSGLFMYEDRKLALRFATKACEMGEISDCAVAAELYSVGFGGVGRDVKKAKYYADKLCAAGVEDACW